MDLVVGMIVSCMVTVGVTMDGDVVDGLVRGQVVNVDGDHVAVDFSQGIKETSFTHPSGTVVLEEVNCVQSK